MKFFVDTAEVDQIAELNDLGMVDGVTTNPSLIMKSGRDIRGGSKPHRGGGSGCFTRRRTRVGLCRGNSHDCPP